jgi:hypothetical protein
LFEIGRDQAKPKTSSWTGAEIRSCCRLAALLDVPLVEAANNVVPVAVTAAESVTRLRDWASGRCLDADVPGVGYAVVFATCVLAIARLAFAKSRIRPSSHTSCV